jgi:hypothetical protein
MYGGVLYCGVLRYKKLTLNQPRNKFRMTLFSVRRLKKLMLIFVSMTDAREADAEPSSA